MLLNHGRLRKSRHTPEQDLSRDLAAEVHQDYKREPLQCIYYLYNICNITQRRH